VSVRPFLGIGAAALAGVVLVSAYGTATASRSGTCVAAAKSGYSYAGHQTGARGHGVRATLTLTRAEVAAGHVASWVGLGGRGQGAHGGDAWIQAGIATVPGMGSLVYAEITREGRAPQFVPLVRSVAPGQSHRIAVLEMAARRSWWRVWVDGRPVTKPVLIRGSSGRWHPVATAESWNGGQAACNGFSYRFEGVAVAHGRGGGWHPFAPRFRFLHTGYRLRRLTASPATAGALGVTTRAPRPYAFVAASGS
jgi:hypothetical protein